MIKKILNYSIVPLSIIVVAVCFTIFIRFIINAHDRKWEYVSIEDANIDIQEIKYGSGIRQIFVYNGIIYNLYDFSKAYVPCDKIQCNVSKNQMGYYRFKINKYITEVEK